MLTLRTAVNAVHTRHRITFTSLPALVNIMALFSHALSTTVTAVIAVLICVLHPGISLDFEHFYRRFSIIRHQLV